MRYADTIVGKLARVRRNFSKMTPYQLRSATQIVDDSCRKTIIGWLADESWCRDGVAFASVFQSSVGLYLPCGERQRRRDNLLWTMAFALCVGSEPTWRGSRFLECRQAEFSIIVGLYEVSNGMRDVE